MTLSIVQSTGSPAASGNAAFTLTGSPVAGNILVGLVAYNGVFALSPPSGAWHKIYDVGNGTPDFDSIAAYWYLVQSGDGTSWTFTVTGDFTSGQLYEITGANTSNPVNGSGTATDHSSPTSRTSPSVTPNVIGCLALAQETTDSGNAVSSVTSGWTALSETGNFHGSAAASKNALTTDTSTAINCTFSYGGGSSPGAVGTILIAPPGTTVSVYGALRQAVRSRKAVSPAGLIYSRVG